MRSEMRVLLLALWIFGVLPAWAEPVALSRYVGNFVTADVEIAGQPARLLFDTGAGVTSITPAFAQHIGCIPVGSITGFRVSGERVVFQKCENVSIALGTRRIARDIGVLDLAALLPADWPPIDGVIGLDVFDNSEITLRLADRQIDTGRRRGAGWREGQMRLQREMGGMGITAFVRVDANHGSLWMLLDSGNMGPTLLSPGALGQLGSANAPQSLAIDGIGPHALEAAASDSAIYDGNLGWSFMRDFDIALDLRHNRIWWRPLQH